MFLAGQATIANSSVTVRLRVFRLAVLIRGVSILVATLRFAIPAIINVGIILFLTYFIYACMGVQVNIQFSNDANAKKPLPSFFTASQ